MSIFKQYTLKRQQLLQLLDRLALIPPALTVYIKSGTGKQEIEKTISSSFDQGTLTTDIVERAAGSPAGAVIFYAGGTSWLISPPFPVDTDKCVRKYSPEPLITMLKRDWRIGLVLVRLGHFAIAVFHGDKLVAYKSGTGLVHARHRQGGSSANRFARHREKQMESFFSRVEVHAREVLEPHLNALDYLFYGGTRDTLQVLWRQCGFFGRLEARAVPRLLNIREPKYSALDDALEQAYIGTVYEYDM
jgi:peptide subunit release factor 1 (eRF1)